MAVSMKTKREKKYQFTSTDFDRVEKQQDFRCYLTGRTYEYHRLKGAPIIPMNKGGKLESGNECLVIDEVKQLKRFFTDEEVLEMAFDIIKTIGGKYGYEAKKKK
ncbi:hypothetical protein EHQ52_03990 [Leptospira koniambonensis]|uniref:HNH endonuclease n=1 Tax=Leptospira koniambonensis TaxID=2484950 RepID=A0A4R9JAC5_9LEPT|nr:hypothetical protein [Leptospira koniambonensis]TGL35936.1 hypothetical protein EHQ52_03990 [Leptospira koniambonensis]